MSDLFLEIKYGKIVGSTVSRWKVKKESPFSGSGRCPICGDSAKSKTLCRFHIREYKGAVFVSCFNCGYSTNLGSFLKTYHESLYSEYVFEKYRNNVVSDSPIITSVPQIPKKVPERVQERSKTLDLPYLSDLPQNHPARLYAASRSLPDYRFQYAENFYEFSSRYKEDLKDVTRDEPRLIIPFFDRAGSVFAYQGRDLSGMAPQKYITIIVNPKIPKVFGIDRIDLKKPIKIVEGPIDSLFLKNCLASVNASLVATAKKLSSVLSKDKITLVYDCEPRNEVIVGHYQSAIKDGYNIVIWPETQSEKDINDLILSGKSPEKIIEQNTYSGLMAQLMFDKWKRVTPKTINILPPRFKK